MGYKFKFTYMYSIYPTLIISLRQEESHFSHCVWSKRQVCCLESSVPHAHVYVGFQVGLGGGWQKERRIGGIGRRRWRLGVTHYILEV